jgi:glycine oxidase ThiO
VPLTERIAVVGAGIIGCAVAFELSRRGATVMVFDGRGLAGGATQASAGILAPYTEAHGGGALFDLTVRGLSVYDEFVDRLRAVASVPFEYCRCGTLEIAEDDLRAGELQARLPVPWAASAGLKWLDADALQASAPYVDAGCVGALECSVHGYVAVRPFADAIADAARRLGVRFNFGSSIARIELTSTRVVLHTDREAHGFDRVILCSGSWTPSVDPLGQASGRIKPVRGQLVSLASAGLGLRQVLWGRACYIVPWTDGTVLVGATSEDVGFDERATVDGVRGLLAAAGELIPALGSATFLDVRVGLRPATDDGLPILGPGTDPRVVYAAGHFRNGILLAPLTAQLIADYVFENRIDPAFSAA